MNEELLASLAEEADAAPPVTPAGLEGVSALAAEVNVLNTDIERVEQDLSRLKTRRWQVLTRELPDLMDQIGVENVTVEGTHYGVETKYHAAVPKDGEAAAFDWLERNDAGDLIKYQVTATFGKDSQDQARAAERYLRERYQDAQIDVKRSVPWARLTSWFKEQCQRAARGEVRQSDIPRELLGATEVRQVAIGQSRKRR